MIDVFALGNLEKNVHISKGLNIVYGLDVQRNHYMEEAKYINDSPFRTSSTSFFSFWIVNHTVSRTVEESLLFMRIVFPDCIICFSQ